VTAGHHRRRYRALASVGLLAAMLVAAVWFVRRHWDEFTTLTIVDLNALWPMLALVPLTIVATGLQLRFLVRPFGVRLTVHEWYGLGVVTAFYNTMTPFRGGMLAKAAYLKHRHELALTGFLAMTAGTSVVNLCVAGVVGLAGLALSLGRDVPGGTVLTLFFAGAAVSTLALMLFTPRLPDSEQPLLARLARVSHGWHLIRSDRAVLAMIWLATGLQYLLTAAGIDLSFKLIGVPVRPETSLVLASLTSLSVLVGITPAGLGVTEAIAVFAGIAVGITPAQSLAAAVARRLATTGVVLVLGPIFTFSLLRGRGAPASPDEKTS
jgi:uncharacterized membrane protein YbhN (UPF0104 family)